MIICSDPQQYRFPKYCWSSTAQEFHIGSTIFSLSSFTINHWQLPPLCTSLTQGKLLLQIHHWWMGKILCNRTLNLFSATVNNAGVQVAKSISPEKLHSNWFKRHILHNYAASLYIYICNLRCYEMHIMFEFQLFSSTFQGLLQKKITGSSRK